MKKFVNAKLDALETERNLFYSMTRDLSDVIRALEPRENDPLWCEFAAKARDLDARTEDWEERITEQIAQISAAMLEEEHGIKLGQVIEDRWGKIFVEEVSIHSGKDSASYYVCGLKFRKDGKIGKSKSGMSFPYVENREQNDCSKRWEEKEQAAAKFGAKLLMDHFGLKIGDDLAYTDKNFGPSKLSIQLAKMYLPISGTLRIEGKRYRNDGSLGIQIVATELTFKKSQAAPPASRDDILKSHGELSRNRLVVASTAKKATLTAYLEAQTQNMACLEVELDSVEDYSDYPAARSGINEGDSSKRRFIELTPYKGTLTGEIGEFLQAFQQRVDKANEESCETEKILCEALFYQQTKCIIGDDREISCKKAMLTGVNLYVDDEGCPYFQVRGLLYNKNGTIGKRGAYERLVAETGKLWGQACDI